MSLFFNRPFEQTFPFNQQFNPQFNQSCNRQSSRPLAQFGGGCTNTCSCPMCQNSFGFNVFAGSVQQPHSLPFPKNPKINSNEISSEIIRRFIQNEKNAEFYYRGLAEKTNLEKNKSILFSISKNAAKEIENAKNICSSLSIEFSEPKEKRVNTQIGFDAGINLALEEENKALSELSSLLDQWGGELCSRLTPIILRKLSRLNCLYLIQRSL